jgi:hypothetical protein
MRNAHVTSLATALAVTVAAVGTSVGAVVASAGPAPTPDQQSLLAARSVLPAASFRAGSPPSGAFLTAGNRADAAANGVTGPATGPYFGAQPIQGISAMVPAAGGTWWALADNGYGTRDTSADWQLPIYRIDPGFGSAAGPRMLETVVLSDPDRLVPWKTVCDPGRGADLPDFSFNVLPSTPPAACGTDPSARILTGFDFDPESIEVGADGTFWIGEEFGPYLLHADSHGRLLEKPISYPGVKSPQNPELGAGEQPTVAQSRGFEGMAISPDREHLYAMFEGAVGTDDAQDVRIVTFDIEHRRFTNEVRKVRLEMPGAKVNLTLLTRGDGSPAYPGSIAPTGTGGESVAELTALDDHRFLLVERDGNGDGVAAPREKKAFVVDTERDGPDGGYVLKSPLVDLMAVPDPQKLGGDGDFFRFPFNTIESVHVVDDHTIIVANDNNYPFSTGRARSRTAGRTSGLAPDDNEFILVDVSASLHPDDRLLSAHS